MFHSKARVQQEYAASKRIITGASAQFFLSRVLFSFRLHQATGQIAKARRRRPNMLIIVVLLAMLFGPASQPGNEGRSTCTVQQGSGSGN
jgi:hypothetical protein